MGNVIGLTCPSCGGTLEILEGIKNVECPYCGSSFILSSRIGAERYYVEPVIRDYRKRIIELTGRKKFTDLDLFFVPIVKVKAEIFGWFYAYKKGKTITVYEDVYDSSGTRVRKPHTVVKGREIVKKGINVLREVTLHTVEHLPIGSQRIELEGLKLLPYDDEKAHTFGSVLDMPESIEFYLQKGLKSLLNGIIGKYRDYDEFLYFLEPVLPHITVIYYPVVLARFQDGHISYDPVKGKVLLRKFFEKRKKKTNKIKVFLLPLFTVLIAFSSLFSKVIGFLLFIILLLFLAGGGDGD